jgi:hypothetical protein
MRISALIHDPVPSVFVGKSISISEHYIRDLLIGLK